MLHLWVNKLKTKLLAPNVIFFFSDLPPEVVETLEQKLELFNSVLDKEVRDCCHQRK